MADGDQLPSRGPGCRQNFGEHCLYAPIGQIGPGRRYFYAVDKSLSTAGCSVGRVGRQSTRESTRGTDRHCAVLDIIMPWRKSLEKTYGICYLAVDHHGGIHARSIDRACMPP